MESTNDTVTATEEYCNVDESTDEALINILLDNDCLAEILSYLTPMQILKTPLVCKKWQTASLLAWKNIKAFYWQRCLYEEKFLKSILSKCGNYLKYMTLEDVKNGPLAWFEDDHYGILRVIGQYCPNLTYLSISYERCVESSDLIDSLSNMKKLKYIKLRKGPVIDASFDLTKDPLEVYESMLSVIPKDIEEIHCLLNEDILVPSESIVASLAEFTAIRCLSLERWKLDRSFIKMITQKYQPLTYLNLHGCEIKNDNLLSKLINRMSHTCKVLKLPLSNKYPTNFEFLKEFKLLESLEVTDPNNDDVIISISNYCENIKNLRIVSKSQTITGNALKNLEKLKDLESLHLELELNDDSFLGNISEHCKKIKQLVILSPTCHQLSWSTISLKEISKMKNLEELSIGSSNNIDDDVEIIVKSCKKLEYFSIFPKQIITKKCSNSLLQIANLKKFNAELFPDITYEKIRNLKMEKLTEFLCSYCDGEITEKCIEKVIKYCPNLKKLEIYGNDMTENVILYAARKTRKRTNHTILSMSVDQYMLYEYLDSGYYLKFKNIYRSPYLNVILGDLYGEIIYED